MGFILLIASVNLTHLLLARATARRRETAIRAALGAGRGRLVRQFLAESLVLGLLGAGAGLLLAVGAIQLLKVFDPGDIPRLAEVTIDMPVLAFTLAVGLLSGVLAGLVPAFQVPYASLINVLRGGDRHFVAGKTERLMRSAFVSAEIALTLVLLVGAVLLTRSFGALLQVDRGFQSENRVFFTITLPPSYEGRSHSGDFIDEFLLHVNGVPESDGVGRGALGPIDGAMPVSMGIRVAPRDARDVTASQATPLVDWRIVTEDYFRALGLPLLRGRRFSEWDEFGPTPIGVDPGFPWRVIISEPLAEMLFADDDPIGRQVLLWVGEVDTPAVLIGVVGNMRERGLDSVPTLVVYLPFKGADFAASLDILVHASRDPLSLVGTLHSVLAELDPERVTLECRVPWKGSWRTRWRAVGSRRFCWRRSRGLRSRWRSSGFTGFKLIR